MLRAASVDYQRAEPPKSKSRTVAKGPQVERAIEDRDPTQSNADSRKSQLAENKKTGPVRSPVRSLLFGAVGSCLLLWVAAYNGYPTVYPDTGGYLYTGAFFIAVPPFRAPGYSVFTRLAGLGASAWFTVAMQAIVVVAVLYEICKHVIGGQSRFRDLCLLAIVCALAALTSLPWIVSELMPDVFAGVVFVSAFLLAFGGRLPLAERIGLAAILAISVTAHMSLLPIAALFVVALAIGRVSAWQVQGALPAKSMLAWLLAPIAVAGLCTATLNRGMGLGFSVSPSGNEFLLARLFGEGLAPDYLRENCPREPFVACRHLADLPSTQEQFLFWSPLLHEMAGHGDEIAEVVRGTVAAHPLRFAISSMKATLLQLAEFRTGDEIRASILHAPNSNGAVILQVFPRDARAFSNSRQARGRMTLMTKVAAIVDVATFVLSLLACVFLARTGRAPRVNQLFYWAVVFLVINAGICASLAGVYDRYQSRVAWIVPLCLFSYVCCLVESRSSRAPETPH
jgi:hypothetical protein